MTVMRLRLLSTILSCLALVGGAFLAHAEPSADEASKGTEAHPEPPEGMAYIPGGTFEMGSEDGLPDERPVHEVTVDPFFMDKHEVTNAEFAAFVEETGYETDAEKWGWSIAFLPYEQPDQRVVGAEWWAKAEGADWRHPTGPDSSIEGKEHYPVVQVSWNDAKAYCEWAGKRLPTEAEWEFAARGGREREPFPWGEQFRPDDQSMANTWNGVFPKNDKGLDGFKGLAPVGQYTPNGYGLYDMSGNVWEWCADWYDPRYYLESERKNPTGPESGKMRVMRGGSYLCADNYCRGYRVAHRNKATADSGLNHTGFRCAKPVESEE